MADGSTEQRTARVSAEEALALHAAGRPGKLEIRIIKPPECFVIEQRLRELMDIPVFHDDQHGTAIVASAGLINACHLTNRNLQQVKLVVNGAGAAAIACVELLKAMGVRPNNVILCD